MVYKYALLVIGILAWLYASVYMFNHCNAWIGIGIFVVGLIISADRIYKKFIKQQ